MQWKTFVTHIMHLIWDDTKLDDIDDDIMEEACVGNGYNLQGCT